MDASVYGGGAIEPLMPANLSFDNIFRAFWQRKKGSLQYKQARELAETSDFFASMIYLKNTFFNDDFNFGQSGQPTDKLSKWLKEQNYDFDRVVNDAWLEWLTCDNVVAFWVRADDQTELPVVTILDCEICDYKNAFGAESLTIKVPKVTLKNAEMKRLSDNGLSERYLDALKKGEELTLDESQGEFFKVLTRAKLGKGLAPPRIGSVLTQLSTMELFGVGDWAAASQMKKVVRQIVKGHDIRNGPLAGQAIHFIKAKESKQIRDNLAKKDGAFDAVTNFDVGFKFPFIDPKYFDDAKFEGTLARLERWAGPLAIMLGDPTTVPMLVDFFETEGTHNRKLVGDFLASIFADENFIGDASPPSDLVPQWNPDSFTTSKMMLETLRMGTSSGLMSHQTGRKRMGLNDKTEGDNMEAAGKKPKRYTPPFEAKQGIVSGESKGGRPPKGPTGEPADPSRSA